jgi:hypothetical protein
MLGDIFLIMWLIVMAAYLIAMKFRYDEVIEQYVKVRIKCLNSPFLSLLLSLLS